VLERAPCADVAADAKLVSKQVNKGYRKDLSEIPEKALGFPFRFSPPRRKRRPPVAEGLNFAPLLGKSVDSVKSDRYALILNPIDSADFGGVEDAQEESQTAS
jgi:hypothetical protein